MNEKKKEKHKTLAEKIIAFDERYLYFVIFIIFSFPLLKPLGLPLVVTEQPRKTFEAIEALEPGSIVVLGLGAESGSWMDQGPPTEAVLTHLMRKPGIRLVGMTISPQGEMFWETALKNVGERGKEYGVDYVWLGFIPGQEVGLASAASDISECFVGTDAYGTPFDELPLMKEINSANDVDLLVVYTWSDLGFFAWLRQWADPYHLKYIIMPLGAQVGIYISFLASGQIYSWVAGTRQAGEYQLLLKEPGPILATMDAQSTGHIFTVLLMIVGNTIFILRKRGKEAQ